MSKQRHAASTHTRSVACAASLYRCSGPCLDRLCDDDESATAPTEGGQTTEWQQGARQQEATAAAGNRSAHTPSQPNTQRMYPTAPWPCVAAAALVASDPHLCVVCDPDLALDPCLDRGLDRGFGPDLCPAHSCRSGVQGAGAVRCGCCRRRGREEREGGQNTGGAKAFNSFFSLHPSFLRHSLLLSPSSSPLPLSLLSRPRSALASQHPSRIIQP